MRPPAAQGVAAVHEPQQVAAAQQGRERAHGQLLRAMSQRASRSAASSSTAPMPALSTSSQRCMDRTMERTRCGAARPTKAMSPVCATAVPVASASSKMSTMRSGASGRPRLWAVASPRDRPSSTRPRHQAPMAVASSTASISAQAPQPMKEVLPSMKACMACMMSGFISSTSDAAAPSTTPTTTPASSRRMVLCTPWASTRVSSTARAAPAKPRP